jgi:putative flippase GtrA
MIRQFTRFVGVGALATLIHVTVALVLEGVAGLAPQAANFGGFLSAILFSYAGHLHFSFGIAPRHAVHGPRFAVTALTSYVASSAIVFVAYDVAGLPFAAAMVIVGAAVPLVTFQVMRLWTFAEEKGSSHHAPRDKTEADDAAP